VESGEQKVAPPQSRSTAPPAEREVGAARRSVARRNGGARRLDDLKRGIDAAPEVINHNIETVERLHPAVRPTPNHLPVIEYVHISRLAPGPVRATCAGASRIPAPEAAELSPGKVPSDNGVDGLATVLTPGTCAGAC